MGKRKELGVEEKVSLVEEYLAGTAADARGGAASWGGSLHHGELDQPVSLRGGSGLRENGNQAKRRYSEEIKRKAVEEYLSGHGSMAIAEKVSAALRESGIGLGKGVS